VCRVQQLSLLLLYFVTVMQHVHGVYICIMHIILLILLYYYAKLFNVYLFISHARRRRFVMFFLLLINIESPTPEKRYCSSDRNLLFSAARGLVTAEVHRPRVHSRLFHKILNDGTNFKKILRERSDFLGLRPPIATVARSTTNSNNM